MAGQVTGGVAGGTEGGINGGVAGEVAGEATGAVADTVETGDKNRAVGSDDTDALTGYEIRHKIQ